jgi:sialic acid synthase SpsE
MEIIAEIGLNHMGDLNKALDMIRIAKECGADIAKFQFYYTDILCVNRNCFDSFKLLDKIRLRPQWIPIIANECKRQNVEFLCTCFDKFSAEEISGYVKRFKIASPEAADLNFVKQVAEFGKPLIISTGKIDDDQIKRILNEVDVPVTLLYCVSKYPSRPGDYKLSEIKRLKKKFHVPVGLSCHCVGIKNALDAVDMHGAEMVEKHFMLSDEKCVDAAVSLLPSDFTKMCEIIRRNNGKRN